MIIPEQGTPLTPAEKSVLALAAQGLTDVHIARRLSVSTGAVSSHMRRARARLGASNRTHATTIAFAEGHLRHTPDGGVAPC